MPTTEPTKIVQHAVSASLNTMSVAERNIRFLTLKAHRPLLRGSSVWEVSVRDALAVRTLIWTPVYATDFYFGIALTEITFTLQSRGYYERPQEVRLRTSLATTAIAGGYVIELEPAKGTRLSKNELRLLTRSVESFLHEKNVTMGIASDGTPLDGNIVHGTCAPVMTAKALCRIDPQVFAV